jgi:hypothetical protein
MWNDATAVYAEIVTCAGATGKLNSTIVRGTSIWLLIV